MATYQAAVLKTHDADTATFAAFLGFGVTVQVVCRFDGIDAPELSTAEGKAALAYLLGLWQRYGTACTLTTDNDKKDKYGRNLARIQLPGCDKTVNEMLVEAGQAKPYDGHGPRLAAAADAGAWWPADAT